MIINDARFKNLEKLFKQRSTGAIFLMGDQAGAKLWSMLEKSSSRLLDFPDRLIIDIMKSAVYYGADYVVICEEKPSYRFDGTVKFMCQRTDFISRLLLKLGRPPRYEAYLTSEYQEAFDDWH